MKSPASFGRVAAASVYGQKHHGHIAEEIGFYPGIECQPDCSCREECQGYFHQQFETQKPPPIKDNDRADGAELNYDLEALLKIRFGPDLEAWRRGLDAQSRIWVEIR